MLNRDEGKNIAMLSINGEQIVSTVDSDNQWLSELAAAIERADDSPRHPAPHTPAQEQVHKSDPEWIRHAEKALCERDREERLADASLQGHATKNPELIELERELCQLLGAGIATMETSDKSNPGTTCMSHDARTEPLPPPTTPKTTPPDLASHFVCPSTLSYHAHKARPALHKLLHVMRNLSRRNMYMEWEGSTDPETQHTLGKTSKTAIDSCNYSLKDKLLNKEGKSRIIFPSYFPGTPIPSRTIKVPEQTLPRLPAWKHIGSDRRAAALEELQFGLRVCSLTCNSGHADLSDWRDRSVSDDVGLLEIRMAGDAAERFLVAAEQSGNATLARGLLRSLESVSDGLTAMVAAWTLSHELPDRVHLYLAIKHVDRRTVEAAITLDRSTRYVQGMDRAGIETYNGIAQPTALRDLQESLQASAGPAEHFLEPPPGVDPEEFTPEHGFASREQVIHREEMIGRRWRRRMREHGLPSWFTSEFLEQLRDYLLRDPTLADERCQVNRRLSKRSRTQSDYDALDYLDMVELELTDIRFHHGSPAQFAALMAASGTVLGSYCGSEHKAGVARTLYEKLRAAQ